jgi:ABC-type Fe3+/spermidine/putrescine transport system ATPase subunit
VARALAARSECVLLDEPLSNLDARLRLHMRGELRRLVKASGTTAVYVTHDQKEALSMADRLAVMNAGRIVQVGAPQAVYDRPATHFVADFLGEANFTAGRVADAGDPARIETACGQLLAAGAGDLPRGAEVTCCVRPERVTIAAGDAAGEAALPATVASCTFLGEIRQYLCRLGDGAEWKVTSLTSAGKPLQAGQAVRLRVAAADVALLPAPPAGLTSP